MRLALRLALLAITLVSIWIFIARRWFPAGASARAGPLDHQFHVAFLVFGVLFAAGQLVLAWVLGRGRKHTSPGRHWRGNLKLELIWTFALIVLLFWFNRSGGRLWPAMVQFCAQPSAVRVEITGAQFQWYFRYPGPDGKFGRIDMQHYARANEGNPLGLDPSDPAGKDDIVASTLVLPAGRDVDLTLRAQDVIHSVFIPAMRFKQDAVPGMTIHAHIQPTRVGAYELVCSQLCGLGHYRMRAAVRVVSDQAFQRWLSAQTQIAAAR